jgi:hypothetical protein
MIKKLLVILIFSTILTGSSFLFGVSLTSKDSGESEIKQEEPQVVEPLSVSLDSIKQISELATAQTTLEVIVPVESSRVLLGVNVGTSAILYRARGVAKAGIDLQQLTQENFIVEGKKVTVRLPNAKLLDVYLDLQNSEIHESSRGTLNLGPDNLSELLDYAQKQATEEMKQTACLTLIPEAETNSEVAIENLLKAAGFEEVVFVPVEVGKTSECGMMVL